MENETSLREIAAALEEFVREKEKNRIYDYRPYLKQLEFHKLGADNDERLLTAGNQLGKTTAGAHEAAYHATGLYPDWWAGKRFERHTRGWVGGESSQVVRDTSQKLLLGDISAGTENLGTGIIPKDRIISVEMARGVAGGVDTVVVKHSTGGASVIKFKSYEMQRQKWQGDSIDWVWFDEEPPLDIYTEGLARLTATRGLAWMTFTPLKGMSQVVERYKREVEPGRVEVIMTVYDAPHLNEADIATLKRRYPVWEHDCRIFGVPMQGEGRVFRIAEQVVTCEPFVIPRYWHKIAGIDLGYGEHPTAIVWMAWDKDNDRLYVYDTYRVKGGSLADHAAVLRQKGNFPTAWPHDAMGNDRLTAATTLVGHYKNLGCNMLPTHSQWPDKSLSVSAGVVELTQRMTDGRFKVFRQLTDWFEEFRNYHTENDKIVAVRDDLLSATRYALMMRRFAKPASDDLMPFGRKAEDKTRIAKGMDYDIFSV